MVSMLLILLLVLYCNGEENQNGTCTKDQVGHLKKESYNLFVKCDGERYTPIGCEVAHLPGYCIDLGKLKSAVNDSQILTAFHEERLPHMHAGCGAKYGPACVCASINDFFASYGHRDTVVYGVSMLAPIYYECDTASYVFISGIYKVTGRFDSKVGEYEFDSMVGRLKDAKCDATIQSSIENVTKICVMENGAICIDLDNLKRRAECYKYYSDIISTCENDARCICRQLINLYNDKKQRRPFLADVFLNDMHATTCPNAYNIASSLRYDPMLKVLSYEQKCQTNLLAHNIVNIAKANDFTCAIQIDQSTRVPELRNRISYSKCWKTQNLVAIYDCHPTLQKIFTRTKQFFTRDEKIMACNTVQRIYDHTAPFAYALENMLNIIECKEREETVIQADRTVISPETETFKREFELVADILQAANATGGIPYYIHPGKRRYEHIK